MQQTIYYRLSLLQHNGMSSTKKMEYASFSVVNDVSYVTGILLSIYFHNESNIVHPVGSYCTNISRYTIYKLSLQCIVPKSVYEFKRAPEDARICRPKHVWLI